MEGLSRRTADSPECGSGPTDELIGRDPRRIEAMFDAIARRYDLLNHLLSAGLDRRWRARAISALHLSGRERLLDLCAGTADMMIAALTRPRSGAAVAIGLDFSAAMLARAQTKLGARKLPATLVRGDASLIPVASTAVDVVTIAFGIRNVQDQPAACAEAYRVLREGGRIAILEFGVPWVPGVRSAYLWYFRSVLPWIGRAVSRHSEAYSYLPASVGTFPPVAEFAARLSAAGFNHVRASPLSFGIVYLYTATKGGRGEESPQRSSLPASS